MSVRPAPPAFERFLPWITLAGFAAGAVIRIVLLPTPGYEGDIDQFVAWARHIAQDGLGHAYDQPISFGPVMVYVWGFLGAIDPAFRTAPNAADPVLRILLKVPAVMADFGLAAGIWYAFQGRPRWAAVVTATALVFPIGWLVSAWWGQYDSIYALFALLAYLLAVGRRETLAVVAMSLALMTKPQAAPLAVPLGAWLLAQLGPPSAESLRRAAWLTVVGVGTIALLWLPFLAAGGAANYVAGIGHYQIYTYSALSFNAWNLWWPVQSAVGGGALVSDGLPVVGPVTPRLAGYAVTAAALLVIWLAVYRRPSTRQLALGMAVAALAAFTFLTTMHERYAYAAVVFLALLADVRTLRSIGLVVAIVVTLNLLAAAAARFTGHGQLLASPLGIVASIAIVVATLRALRELSAPVRAAGR